MVYDLHLAQLAQTCACRRDTNNVRVRVWSEVFSENVHALTFSMYPISKQRIKTFTFEESPDVGGGEIHCFDEG